MRFGESVGSTTRRAARLAAILITPVLAMAFVSCSSTGGEAAVLDVDEAGLSTIDNDALTEAIGATTTTTLTDAEVQGLLFMREEEKLARDVYLQLYERWGTNTFGNIGDSEQTHTDAVNSLIDKYGLSDPAADKEVGEYENAILQQLHDDLIAQGDQSEIAALEVGGAIEEIDILDIEKYMAQTNNPDILLVYENLIKGSRNHLRSFVSVMAKRGVTYEPQYLDAAQYQEIVGSDIERGGR